MQKYFHDDTFSINEVLKEIFKDHPYDIETVKDMIIIKAKCGNIKREDYDKKINEFNTDVFFILRNNYVKN
jgi:hypothetical protein